MPKRVNRVHHVQKNDFFQNDPGPHGMPTQVFLSRFELLVACFGPPNSQNSLKMGCFCDEKWVKNGSKMCFSKNDPRPFGVPKQVK